MMSEKKPYVAVVLPVYNVAEYLPKNLDSLLAQNYQHFCVFAVDDGAKDNSGAILDSYSSRDARIKVFHKENGGPSSARNFALDKIAECAEFTYVAFLDADDYVAPNWLKRLVDEMEKTQADYAVFAFQCFTKEGMQAIKGGTAKNRMMDTQGIAEQFFRVDTKTGCGLPTDSTSSYFLNNRFFRWEAIKSLRFNETLWSCEDRDFLIRAMPFFKIGIQLSDVLFFYRRRLSSLSNGRSAKVTDFLVYQKLFNERHNFLKAIRVGIEVEFFNHMFQELYAKLSSRLNNSEQRSFYNYCIKMTAISLEVPFNRSLLKKIKRLNKGYAFNRLWALGREALRRVRNMLRKHRYYS